MKFMENWKRFWTLNRHHAEGFTLVELIVVIAILAILAGVAVPAYSGYVTQANKQADMSLAGGIEQALLLQFYAAEGMVDSAYVVVTESDAFVADDDIFAQEAMDKAFGDGWETSVRIKYDGWKNAARMLDQVKNNPDLAAINESSYIKDIGTDKLMSDMQLVVNDLGKYIEKLPGGAGITGLDKYLGGGTYIKDYVKDYENPNSTVLANAAVMGLANSMKNDSAKIQENFANGTYILKNSAVGAQLGAQLGLNVTHEALGSDAYNDNQANENQILMDSAHTYAALEAFVGALGDAEATRIFNSKLDFSSTGYDKTKVVEQIVSACDEVMIYVANDTTGKLQEKAAAYLTSGGAAKDGQAYVSVMQTVNNLDKDYLDSMDNATLFTDGTISNDVDDLIAAASLSQALANDPKLQAIAGNLEGSAIIVVVTNVNGAPVCTVLPVDAQPQG